MNVWKAIRATLNARHWKALSRGVVPTIEHAAGLAGVVPATVIDIGANKGQFSAFARARWPLARIIAFEPLPGPSRRFRSVLGEGATLHNCALGNAEATLDIHIASREDSSSLLPIGNRQVEEFHTAEVATLKVPVRRLDSVLDKGSVDAPALLKIDVQGYEYEALQGCTGLLGLIEWFYVEVSFAELYEGQRLYPEVVELLDTLGFRPVREHNVQFGRSGGKIQADVLFARQPGANA